MPIKMVKKQLANGDPCRKCLQAEQLLRDRGLWNHIDEVIWAVEGEPESEGMRLGAHHGVDTAPFFIVKNGKGHETVYRNALRLIQEHFPEASLKQRLRRNEDWEQLARVYADKHPSEILGWGLSRYGTDCAIAFSGAEDVVLVDMAAKTGYEFSVFCLDTGRLHPETYRFIEKVRTHYGIDIEIVSPDTRRLQAFVRRKGLFSFYEDGHQECCTVRKVEPLRRQLRNYQAWAAGQRKDQSPATRADIPVIQLDKSFEGHDGALVKLNPLANWTSAQTWAYIREHDVPYNELHERGFVSIGCEPCTRPIHPAQHEREGRWWWEDATLKECGLHTEKKGDARGRNI